MKSIRVEGFKEGTLLLMELLDKDGKFKIGKKGEVGWYRLIGKSDPMLLFGKRLHIIDE